MKNPFTVREALIGASVGFILGGLVISGVVEIRLNTPFYQSHPPTPCKVPITSP